MFFNARSFTALQLSNANELKTAREQLASLERDVHIGQRRQSPSDWHLLAVGESPRKLVDIRLRSHAEVLPCVFPAASTFCAQAQAGRRHETWLTAGQTTGGIKKMLPVADHARAYRLRRRRHGGFVSFVGIVAAR